MSYKFLTFCMAGMLGLSLVGCSGDRGTAVLDENQMTPEQQAAQDAYVADMDGPAPVETETATDGAAAPAETEAKSE